MQRKHNIPKMIIPCWNYMKWHTSKEKTLNIISYKLWTVLYGSG